MRTEMSYFVTAKDGAGAKAAAELRASENPQYGADPRVIDWVSFETHPVTRASAPVGELWWEVRFSVEVDQIQGFTKEYDGPLGPGISRPTVGHNG